MILAIDPGTHESGFCLYDEGRVVSAGVMDNHDLLKIVADDRSDVLAIEKVVSYGRAVGQEVFDTCEWAGRFRQVWGAPDETLSVTRLQVKKALGLAGSADDAKVNARLREVVGEKGTKGNPGPTYGVKSHAWAALGVAYAAAKLVSH
jgi:hypothetical protein